MSEIYKINKVVNKEITKIYIFSGNRKITEKDYTDIFTIPRLKTIEENERLNTKLMYYSVLYQERIKKC
jgi:hypothetical protein